MCVQIYISSSFERAEVNLGLASLQSITYVQIRIDSFFEQDKLIFSLN